MRWKGYLDSAPAAVFITAIVAGGLLHLPLWYLLVWILGLTNLFLIILLHHPKRGFVIFGAIFEALWMPVAGVVDHSKLQLSKPFLYADGQAVQHKRELSSILRRAVFIMGTTMSVQSPEMPVVIVCCVFLSSSFLQIARGVIKRATNGEGGGVSGVIKRATNGEDDGVIKRDTNGEGDGVRSVNRHATNGEVDELAGSRLYENRRPAASESPVVSSGHYVAPQSSSFNIRNYYALNVAILASSMLYVVRACIPVLEIVSILILTVVTDVENQQNIMAFAQKTRPYSFDGLMDSVFLGGMICVDFLLCSRLFIHMLCNSYGLIAICLSYCNAFATVLEFASKVVTVMKNELSPIWSMKRANRRDLYLRNDVCAICLNRMQNNARVTPCNHLLHGKCLRLSLRNDVNCPLCRSKLIVTLNSGHAINVF